MELKVSEQDDDSDEDENIPLLVRKFGKFLKKDKIVIFGKWGGINTPHIYCTKREPF